MQTLPPIIRDYLSAGKYTTVARNLTTKYGLRIDQAGVLEREIMLLLMGIETPQEFAQALTEEARLDKKIVDSIALDVNEQVFIPLRTEEQKIGMNKASSPAMPEMKKEIVPTYAGVIQKGAPAAVPPKGITNLLKKDEPPTPAVAPLPPKFSGNEATMKTQVESRTRELPPKVPSPARLSATLGEIVRSLLPGAKPLDSRLLLEDHEEPSPSLKSIETPALKPVESLKTAPAASEQTEKPQAFGSRIIPNFAPVNLPGALPEVQVPSTPSHPEEPTAPLPAEAPEPARLPSNKSYAADPYREPIDEDKS